MLTYITFIDQNCVDLYYNNHKLHAEKVIIFLIYKPFLQQQESQETESPQLHAPQSPSARLNNVCIYLLHTIIYEWDRN